jgi:hypothetical protein
MSGVLNLTRWLKPQGLDSKTRYEAVVVDIKDPRKLCRVRARIPFLFDGIEDKHLPWATPIFSHIGGAYRDEKGEAPTERSGVAYVPTVGSKVFLSFMEGDPSYPLWSGYTLDDKTALTEEMCGPDANKEGEDKDDRYPHRVVVRMRHGAYLILDTKNKEIFVNSPGDMYLTVLGDVHETIIGNKTSKVTSKTTDIPDYIKSAPASKLAEMEQKRNRKVPWEGLTPDKPKGGNHHVFVEGDMTVEVKGNRLVKIWGNNREEVMGQERVQVAGDRTVVAQNIYHQES